MIVAKYQRRMMFVRLLAGICIAADLSGCAVERAEPSRPEIWAKKVDPNREGLPNFYKVSDALYRCMQPTSTGMLNARKMGIKTVVNLRAFHSDHDELAGSGLQHEQIFVKTWHPEEEDVVKFLKIATNPGKVPVLVHCQHGADRTGEMCAIYRIVVQGWCKEEAIREMRQGEYGYHVIWKKLPPWIRSLDVEKLRNEVGIHPKHPCGE